MTCVVGACHNGKIYIGADSLSTDTQDSSKRISGVPKVFVKDQYIIGGAGSWRAIQVLRHADLPKVPRNVSDFDNLEKFMVTKFIDSFEEIMKSHGVKEAEYSFLIGVNGCLFTLEEDHQINYHIDFPYDVIGSGYPYALGAIHAMWEIPKMSIEEKIEKAIRTSEFFSSSTGGPIKVLSV